MHLPSSQAIQRRCWNLVAEIESLPMISLVSDRKEAMEHKGDVRTDRVSSSKPSNWAPQTLTLQVWGEETAKNAEVCLRHHLCSWAPNLQLARTEEGSSGEGWA